MPQEVRTEEAKFLYVRLKPYDPNNGFTCQRYSLARFNVTLKANSGWLRVPASLGKYIARLTQDPNNRKSPLLADVCTRQEADEIERQELINRRRQAMSNVISDSTNLTHEQIEELQLAELEKQALVDVGISDEPVVDEDEFDDEDVLLSAISAVPSARYDSGVNEAAQEALEVERIQKDLEGTDNVDNELALRDVDENEQEDEQTSEDSTKPTKASAKPPKEQKRAASSKKTTTKTKKASTKKSGGSSKTK